MNLLASLKCRFGCEDPPVVLVRFTGGCACYPDRIQALCSQHWQTAEPTGGGCEVIHDLSCEWQPIATAPRNARVLVWCPWIGIAGIGRNTTDRLPKGWRVKFSAADNPMRVHSEPSHWMPLPQPPSGSGTQ